jgi:hypothetical protein
MLHRLLLLNVFLFSFNAFAQITFEKQYGDSLNENLLSVKQTSDGGYIAIGHTLITGNNDQDVYILKTNSLGDKIWSKYFSWSLLDIGKSIVETNDGYVLTGSSTGLNANGKENIFLIKLDLNGDSIWGKTYLSNLAEASEDLIKTNDGGFLISGSKFVSPPFKRDLYIIKTNNLGDTLWTRTIGGSKVEFGYSVQQTQDGGYIVGGSSTSTGAGGSDGYLVKIDSSGNTLWSKTFGGMQNDVFQSVKQTRDGGYILGGRTDSYGAGGSDLYLLKTDSTGTEEWFKYWGGLNSDRGNSVTPLQDGGYMLAGYINNETTSLNELYAVRTDGNGDTLWTKNYSGNGLAMGYAVIQTNDDGFLLAGHTAVQIYVKGLAYLIKLGPEPCDTTFSTVNVSACDSYTSPSGNHTWINSGVYTDTLLNTFGCDSIITINLTINNNSSNHLSGTVFFNYEPVQTGTVTLIQKDGTSPQEVFEIATKNISGNGTFYFDSLEVGNYIVKAIGDTALNSYISTYSDSSKQWQSATIYTINLGCLDTIKNVDIHLLSFTSSLGSGVVNGQILNISARRTSEPLPGVDISMEEDPDGKIVAYTKSDLDGNFSLKSIDFGNYKLLAELEGYRMDTTEVFTFDGNSKGYNVVICVSDSTGEINVCSKILTLITSIESSKIFRIFPNPSSEKINIHFVREQLFSIEIIDLQGKTVVSETSLRNNAEINISQLDAGIYTLRFNSNDTEYLEKIIIKK